MKTSLKTGFAQIFSRCPKNLTCPKFRGGGCSPPRPPGPYAYACTLPYIDVMQRHFNFKTLKILKLEDLRSPYHKYQDE